MDSKELENILAKYWDCETSLEEEKQLREYFSRSDIPDEYRSVAELFHYYTNQKSEDLGEAFEMEIITKLKTEPSTKPEGRVVKWVTDALKVAAVIVILVTAGYYLKQEYIKTKDSPYLADTFEDPKEAFEETKKALMMISKNFKKGKKEASKISSFNEAKEKVKNRKNEL